MTEYHYSTPKWGCLSSLLSVCQKVRVEPPTQEHNALSVANADILVKFLHLILTVQRSLTTTHPLHVVHTIYLLVLWVRAIVTSSDRQKYYVLLKGVLQGQGHRDTTPVTSKVRRHAMNCSRKRGYQKLRCIHLFSTLFPKGNPAIIV